MNLKSLRNSPAPFCLATTFLLGFGEAQGQSVLTLKDLTGHVRQVLNADEIGANRKKMEVAIQQAESMLFGATELEVEAELNKNGMTDVYQVMVNQPLLFNANSDARRKVGEQSERLRGSEFDQELRSVVTVVAGLIIEESYTKKKIEVLTNAVKILQDMSALLAISKGQATAIATSQTAEKLRHRQELLKAETEHLTSLRASLAMWQIKPETQIEVVVPELNDLLAKVDQQPEIEQALLRAAVADAKASAESGKFELALGLGSQVNQANDEKSYIIRLSAPLGQIHTNRYLANQFLQEKAVLNDRARLLSAQQKERMSTLYGELRKEKSLLASQRSSMVTAEKLYEMTKLGFQNGFVDFVALNDAFDRFLEASDVAIEMDKNFLSLKLEVYNVSGGWL